VQYDVINWSHNYGLNDEICAPVVATVAQFFTLSPMLFGVVMLATSSSHNSGAIAAGRLADKLASSEVVNAGARLAVNAASKATAKAFASRLAVPTVLSTGNAKRNRIGWRHSTSSS